MPSRDEARTPADAGYRAAHKHLRRRGSCVRFPAPLPVGAQYRGGAEVVEVKEVPGGVQMKLTVTIEVKGSEKPAMVTESLVRLYA